MSHRVRRVEREEYEEREDIWRDISISQEEMVDYISKLARSSAASKSPIVVMKMHDAASASIVSNILRLFSGYIIDDKIYVTVRSYSEAHTLTAEEELHSEISMYHGRAPGNLHVVAFITDVDIALEQESAQPGQSGIQRFISAVARFYGFSAIRGYRYKMAILTSMPERLANTSIFFTLADLVVAPQISSSIRSLKKPEISSQALLPQGLSPIRRTKRFSELVLSQSIADIISRAILKPLSRNPHFFKSIMIFGPPGGGKTTLASSIAYELGVRAAKLNIEGMLSKWFGETERNMGAALDGFSRSGGGFLIIRNIESIFVQHNTGTGGEDSTMARTREILVNKIMEGAENVVMVITVSSISKLPEYLVKDPIFGNIKIPIPPPPSKEHVKALLTSFIERYTAEVGVSVNRDQKMENAINYISEAIVGYTPREIEAIAKHAVIAAVASGRDTLSITDLYTAVESFTVDLVTRASDLESMYRTSKMLGAPTMVLNEIERLMQIVNSKKNKRSILS